MPKKRAFSSLEVDEGRVSNLHQQIPVKKQKVAPGKGQHQAAPKPASGGNRSASANGSTPAKQKRIKDPHQYARQRKGDSVKQLSKPSQPSSAAPAPRANHAETPAKRNGPSASNSNAAAFLASEKTVPGQPEVLEAPEHLSKKQKKRWRRMQRASMGDTAMSSPATSSATPTAASRPQISQNSAAVHGQTDSEASMPPPPLPLTKSGTVKPVVPAKRSASTEGDDIKIANLSSAAPDERPQQQGHARIRKVDVDLLREATSTVLARPPKKAWTNVRKDQPALILRDPRRTADIGCQTDFPSSNVLSSSNLDIYTKAMKHVLDCMGVEEAIGASEEMFKERIARSLSSMSPTLLRRPSTAGTQRDVDTGVAQPSAGVPEVPSAQDRFAAASAQEVARRDDGESDEEESEESGDFSNEEASDDDDAMIVDPATAEKTMPPAVQQPSQVVADKGRQEEDEESEESGDSGEADATSTVAVSLIDNKIKTKSEDRNAAPTEEMTAVNRPDQSSDAEDASTDEESESDDDENALEAPVASRAMETVLSPAPVDQDEAERQSQTKPAPDEKSKILSRSASSASVGVAGVPGATPNTQGATLAPAVPTMSSARFPSFNDTLRSFPRSSVLSSRSLFSPKPSPAPKVDRAEDRAEAYKRFTAFTGGDDSSEDSSGDSDSDDEREKTQVKGFGKTAAAVTATPRASLRETNNARASQQLTEEAEAAAQNAAPKSQPEQAKVVQQEEASSGDSSSSDEEENLASTSDEEDEDSDASDSDDDGEADVPSGSVPEPSGGGVALPPQTDGAMDHEVDVEDEESESEDEEEDEEQDEPKSSSANGAAVNAFDHGILGHEAVALPEGTAAAVVGSNSKQVSRDGIGDESRESYADDEEGSDSDDNSSSVEHGAAALADQIEVPETTQEDAEAISDGYSEDDDEMKDVPAKPSRRSSAELQSDRVTTSVSSSLSRRPRLPKAALQDDETAGLRRLRSVANSQSQDPTKTSSEPSFLGQRRGYTGSRRARDSDKASLHDSPMKPISFRDTDSDVDKTIEEIENEVFGSTKALPPGKQHDFDEDKENHLTDDGRLVHIIPKDGRRRILGDARFPVPTVETVCASAVHVPNLEPREVVQSDQNSTNVGNAAPSPGHLSLRRTISISTLSELGSTPSPPPEVLECAAALYRRVEEASVSQHAQGSIKPAPKKRRMAGMKSKHFTPEKPKKQPKRKAKEVTHTTPSDEELENGIGGFHSPAIDADNVAPSPASDNQTPAAGGGRPRAKRKSTGKKSHHFLPMHLLDRVDLPSPDRKPGHVPAGVSVAPVPPVSSARFGIIQEKLWDQPFWLLIAVTFLNKTRGQVAAPIFWTLKERYPASADLAQAKFDDIFEMVHCLGFQTQRTNRLISMAKAWEKCPPEKGRRYKSKNYPNKGDHAEYNRVAVIEGDAQDVKGANEIAHVPGCGAYAWDSWRIFCRDVLRGQAEDYNGKNAVDDEFEPEWKRVIPEDKELRATLRWMWLKESWIWDHHTGEKRRATQEEMERARKGEMDVPDAQERKFAAQAVGVESVQDEL